MRVWRVCKRRHAAFDGQGARLAGGRWNHPGTAIVYAYETVALATLELLVPLGGHELPGDMVVASAEIPDSVYRFRVDANVPEDAWRVYPAPKGLCDVGTGWVTDRKSAVMIVPSAIVPGERTYLLNPAHSAFREITVYPPQPFVLRAAPRRA
jgi:RES domain-containing protein